MTEYPIFVPVDGEYVAAVMTIPDVQPHGVVVLVQGTGTPRSHRNRIWTRTARALAARGVASVRIDPGASGDTTGPRGSEDDRRIQTGAVAEVAMAAAGTRRLAFIGNCSGARTAFALSAGALPGAAVGCIIFGRPRRIMASEGRRRKPGTHRSDELSHVGAEGSGQKAVGGSSSRGRRMAASHGRLTDFVARARRAIVRRMKPPPAFMPEVAVAASRADVLFLVLGHAAQIDRFRQSIDRHLRSSPRSSSGVSLRTLPIVNASGFRIPLEMQGGFIDELVDWADSTLTAAPSAMLAT